MIFLNAVFLDADDCKVNSQVVPCETIDVAKKLANKLAEKVFDENHEFDSKEERDECFKNWTWRTDDGMKINIEGYEGGYAEFTIIEQNEVISEETIDSVDFGEVIF